MAKFGLGRGLADLQNEMVNIPDISVLNSENRVVVRQIPLVQIGANPDQPRKTFTESELTDLTASIREKGVLQPIILRPVIGREYKYEIVAGERRYRASHLAGLSEIPALVKNLNDDNAMEIALIENVQRENLNPIEEGAAYKNIMTKCGYSMADVSRLIGKSESYIRNTMRLNSNLPESVKNMVRSGELSASHARTIAVSDNPEGIAREIIARGLSVAETAKRVKQGTRRSGGRAYTNKTIDDAARRDIESRIGVALGVPVKLQERRGGAGQIVLSFATRTQMNELVEKLTK